MKLSQLALLVSTVCISALWAEPGNGNFVLDEQPWLTSGSETSEATAPTPPPRADGYPAELELRAGVHSTPVTRTSPVTGLTPVAQSSREVSEFAPCPIRIVKGLAPPLIR